MGGLGRMLALAAVVGGSLSACGGTTAAKPSTIKGTTAPAAALLWAPCDGGVAGIQCARLQVPIKDPDPSGATITIAIARQRATGSRIGSLLVNPGGPGVSAVDALPAIDEQLSPSLRAHFDIVAFDPPGVGHSQAITCLDGPALDRLLHLDPAPSDAAGFDALAAAARELAAGCQDRNPTTLAHVSTADAARAMDYVRQALGDLQLTYLGFSYGTLLGATYAEMFPARVRALVLDGALDPALDPVEVSDAQAAALDHQLTDFEQDCAARAGCAWRPAGRNRAADFSSLLERVRHQPLPAGSSGRTVGPGELFYGVAAGLYEPATWGRLASALAAADRYDGAPLLAMFDAYVGRRTDGSYLPVLESEMAVNCLDSPVPSVTAIRADEPAAAAGSPDFGVGVLLSALNCAVWPVPPEGKPHPIHAPGAPSIVVVGSTEDPITPYAWSQNLAGELDHGVLLTRVGAGHTGYGASSCIRQAIDTYLVDLRPPAAGTRCPPGG